MILESSLIFIAKATKHEMVKQIAAEIQSR